MFKFRGKNALMILICVAAVGFAIAAPGNAIDLPADQQNQMEKGIKFLINDRLVQPEEEAFIEEGTTFIPLRGVLEELGASVVWEEENQAVVIHADRIRVELVIGSDAAKITKTVDGATVEEYLPLAAPARIVKERTFIPVRFVAEALGFNVDWVAETETIIIAGSFLNQQQIIEKVDITGDIVQLESTTILVEGPVAGGAQYDKAYVSFHEDTEIVSGETKESFDPKDLEVGMMVEVVFDGSLRDSYPVQAKAKRITVYENNSFRQEIGPSLAEMDLAISAERVKEMTLYTLMGEKVKTFNQEEITGIVNSLNTSPIYTGAYILMLAGNSITITLENDDSIQLTSFGSKDYVVLSGHIDGETISACIMSPEVGAILLSDAEL